MPGTGTKRIGILLILLTLTGSAVLSFCGNNPFHQREAVGMVTMEQCLKCHGSAMGKAISICLGDKCLYTRNHSIMHPYPPRGKAMRYASVAEIQQAGCILEDGKTTCLSCHDLTKPPPHVIREGDQLCLICHIDKTSLTP